MNCVLNFHSIPECCPENAHKFLSSQVHVISDFIVNLKALCFFPSVPQLFEMFLLTNVTGTCIHTKLGRHCCDHFCCTTKYCLCQSAVFVIQTASKKQLIQENTHISSQRLHIFSKVGHWNAVMHNIMISYCYLTELEISVKKLGSKS